MSSLIGIAFLSLIGLRHHLSNPFDILNHPMGDLQPNQLNLNISLTDFFLMQGRMTSLAIQNFIRRHLNICLVVVIISKFNQGQQLNPTHLMVQAIGF